MGHVTDVILKTGVGEVEESAAIKNINKHLISHGKGNLVKVDEYCGGKKYMGSDIYMGAFNFLDIEKFLLVFYNQDWADDESVQMFIQEEHEDLFKEYKNVPR